MTTTTPTPRVPPVEIEECDDETRALLETLGGLNIFRTLAHHPKLLKRWLVFGSHVLAKSTLPDRERELLILRVGWRCGSDYEFGQHRSIGARAGLSEQEIRRLCAEGTEGWSPSDAALVTAADELLSDHMLSDATWEALAADWSTPQVMDIVFAVGQYVLTCTALRSFGVVRDEGVPGFPS